MNARSGVDPGLDLGLGEGVSDRLAGMLTDREIRPRSRLVGVWLVLALGVGESPRPVKVRALAGLLRSHPANLRRDLAELTRSGWLCRVDRAWPGGPWRYRLGCRFNP